MAFGKFAKYTPDEIAFSPADFDLVRVLEDCRDAVAADDAGRHPIEFEHFVPACPVHTDPRHVKLIVMNLLQNAVKYSVAGAAVTLRLYPIADRLAFSVSDHGIGIPEGALSELFSPFFRADNVAERPGSGLGLAILKRSAKTINANVQVDSREGSGTTFVVTLPKTAGAGAYGRGRPAS